jgi:hypothetical protein
MPRQMAQKGYGRSRFHSAEPPLGISTYIVGLVDVQKQARRKDAVLIDINENPSRQVRQFEERSFCGSWLIRKPVL